MIGKAYVSLFKYYDKQRQSMSFKKRPVLIIGQADSSDYIVLPISRITSQHNIDSCYDVPMEPCRLPLMNLKQKSYVRTHKQAVINYRELSTEIVDFKTVYSEIYSEIISKVDKFQKELIEKAL